MKTLHLPAPLEFNETFDLCVNLFAKSGISFHPGAGQERENGRAWLSNGHSIEESRTEQTYDWDPTEVTKSLSLKGLPGISICRFLTPRQIINSSARFRFWEADGEAGAVAAIESALKELLFSSADSSDTRNHVTLAPEWKTGKLGAETESWTWLQDYYLVRDSDPPLVLSKVAAGYRGCFHENGSKISIGFLPGDHRGSKSISLRIYARTPAPDVLTIFKTIFAADELLQEVRFSPEEFLSGCFLGMVKEPDISFRAYESENWWLRQSTGRNIYGGFRDAYAIQPRSQGNLAMLALHEIFGGSTQVSRDGLVDHNFFAVFTGETGAVSAALQNLRDFFYSMKWEPGN